MIMHEMLCRFDEASPKNISYLSVKESFNWGGKTKFQLSEIESFSNDYIGRKNEEDNETNVSTASVSERFRSSTRQSVE